MFFQSGVAGPVLESVKVNRRQDINPVFAGQGIRMTKAVRPAEEIMADLVEGMEKSLKDSTKLYS